MAWAGSIASRAVLRMRSGRVASGPVTLGDAPRTESHVEDRAGDASADRDRGELIWHRVLDAVDLPEGRVTTVTRGTTRSRSRTSTAPTARSTTAARTRAARSARARSRRACCAARGTATTTTRSPAAARRLRRRVAVASRSRCATTASTSASRRRAAHERTVSDVMARDAGRVGGHPRLRHGRALEPRLRRRDAPAPRRPASCASSASATRAPPRSPPSAYGKLTGRPAACFAIAGPGLDQPPHRPLRRQASTARRSSRLRPGALEGARAGAPSRTSTCRGAFGDVAASSQTVHARQPTTPSWRRWPSSTRCSTPRRGAPRPARRGADRSPARRAGRRARRAARRPARSRRPTAALDRAVELHRAAPSGR